MDTLVTTSGLLETMQTRRAGWEALLAQVGEERMLLPGVEGNWSIKDIIAHVTWYEHWLTTWLKAVARDEVLARGEIDELSLDERNAWIFEHNHARPLEDVRAEARQVFAELVQTASRFADRDLTDLTRFERFIAPYWSNKPPLSECIAGDSYEHYQEHISPVTAWLASLDSK